MYKVQDSHTRVLGSSLSQSRLWLCLGNKSAGERLYLWLYININSLRNIDDIYSLGFVYMDTKFPYLIRADCHEEEFDEML